MANPSVNITTGHVSWIDPVDGTDGLPLAGGDVPTSYGVGIRSLTASGSVAGTYPHTATVAANVTTCALTALTPPLTPDSYAVAVQAVSANGASQWSTEFDFQGVLPVPLAPTGVSVS